LVLISSPGFGARTLGIAFPAAILIGSRFRRPKFYGALGNGKIPPSTERLEQIRIALSFVTICLETFALFFDRFLHQGRQAEIVAVSRQTA